MRLEVVHGPFVNGKGKPPCIPASAMRVDAGSVHVERRGETVGLRSLQHVDCGEEGEVRMRDDVQDVMSGKGRGRSGCWVCSL